MAEFRRYVAVVEQNKSGRYFAHLPDLPGVTAAASSIGEALSLVADFAEDHVADLAKEQHDIPAARTWEDVPHDPDVTEVLRAYVPVRVPAKAPRAVKISITIDEEVLERVDRAAGEMGESRSGFLASAAAERAAKMLERPFDQERFVREFQKEPEGLNAIIAALNDAADRMNHALRQQKAANAEPSSAVKKRA